MGFFNRLSHVVKSQWNQWVDHLEHWVEEEEHRQKEKKTDFFSQEGSTSQAPAGQDPRLAKYYANLEVSYGASFEEVKQSYRRLIKKYHPDLHERDPEKRHLAEQVLKRLNEAFYALEAHLKP